MNLNNLYGRLSYMKKTCPDKYEAFVKAEGKCQKCNTTIDVSPYKLNGNIKVLCRSCKFIVDDCSRLGLVESVYMGERELMVNEIISALEGNKEIMKHVNEKDVTRDMQIYRMHLLGRSHAHIAREFGISRERVRQLVYRFKK